jgi:hypothetical protein
MAADKGNLLLSRDERLALLAQSPQAERFILPFYGSREFINGIDRFCLWLDGVPEAEWRAIPEVVRRVEATRAIRLDSARPQLAATPHLFAQITQRPVAPFLIVPRTSSERRRYVPMAFFEPGHVASDGCLVIVGATLADFALLNSEMHMDWVRTVGGRLKSDYRYSKDVVYNNFVFPEVDASTSEELTRLAGAVLEARASHAERTLSWLYDEATMPRSLREAHAELDRTVEGLYRAKPFASAGDRVSHLLELHQSREAGLLSATRPRGRKR